MSKMTVRDVAQAILNECLRPEDAQDIAAIFGQYAIDGNRPRFLAAKAAYLKSAGEKLEARIAAESDS